MASASLILPNGTKVTVEGTADEVAVLLRSFAGSAEAAPASAVGHRRRITARARASEDGSPRSAPMGPVEYIRELAAIDFFKTKQGLGDVQRRLEEGAHIYPVTTLSPALFRLVRKKELRRIKEGGAWKYVNP